MPDGSQPISSPPSAPLAAPTPDVGHLHPSHGYDAVVERLLDFVERVTTD